MVDGFFSNTEGSKKISELFIEIHKTGHQDDGDLSTQRSFKAEASTFLV
jgi:hypothetical protein